jgi:hypothetical protein
MADRNIPVGFLCRDGLEGSGRVSCDGRTAYSDRLADKLPDAYTYTDPQRDPYPVALLDAASNRYTLAEPDTHEIKKWERTITSPIISRHLPYAKHPAGSRN